MSQIITKIDIFSEEFWKLVTEEFSKTPKNNELQTCPQSNILNIDQCDFQYEIVANRAIDIKAYKDVDARVISKIKTTDSYTA